MFSIYTNGVDFLSVSKENKTDWIYRIQDKRPITIKAKNKEIKKISAIDIASNIPFGIDVAEDFSADNAEIEKSYLATLKVYTARNVKNVSAEHMEFFKQVDVDQDTQNFIQAYWLYPKYVKFELAKIEPLQT